MKSYFEREIKILDSIVSIPLKKDTNREFNTATDAQLIYKLMRTTL